MMELSNQLRMVQETMRSDLEGVTVDMRPWAITAGPDGYFEYIEGPRTDLTSGTGVDSIFGDNDDIICMTTRASNGAEFRGRGLGGNITSNVAEVIWWTNYEDRPGSAVGLDYDESLKVFRRNLLIIPNTPSVAAANIAAVYDFFRHFDISMRWVDTDSDNVRDTLVANSLEDLAKRENRFAHWSNTYPYLLTGADLQQCQMNDTTMGGTDLRFAGIDIKIADILAFDVQVYSPDVEVRSSNNITLIPTDPGYAAAVTGVDQGAFVDLGFSGAVFDPTAVQFSTRPARAGFWGVENVLDTFSKHYESNGLDEDGDALSDEGTNNLDDDAANGVDDNGERETLPPYPFRISGIKVKFRVVDRNTKQVRQTSLTHSFLPK